MLFVGVFVPQRGNGYPFLFNQIPPKEARLKTLYMLYPLSERAKEWINQNVDYQSYQMVGEGVGIEW